jgi:hypothetical protein
MVAKRDWQLPKKIKREIIIFLNTITHSNLFRSIWQSKFLSL